jgi:SAM-dependent methyltransferase
MQTRNRLRRPEPDAIADDRSEGRTMVVLRPDDTGAEREILEADWWRRFSAVEEQYAWVQPAATRWLLRRHYVREIINETDLDGTIVELGCGSGWLCRDLARAGATRVVGLDFSETQIEIARRRAARENLEGRVSFHVSDLSKTDFIDSLGASTFLIHGFLHHLDKTQIRSVIDGIGNALPCDGKLVVFEPVRQSREVDAERQIVWETLLRWLMSLASRGQRHGLRRFCEDERATRALLASRNVGIAPFGPSPKEIPFCSGELESYLSKQFNVIEAKPVMTMSHLVMQEWLLREMSHPVSSKLLMPAVASLANWLDRKLARTGAASNGMWIFTLFKCLAHPNKDNSPR